MAPGPGLARRKGLYLMNLGFSHAHCQVPGSSSGQARGFYSALWTEGGKHPRRGGVPAT